jgi:hypothetical protein
VYTSVAFSPDGGTFASASNNGSVRPWSGFLWPDFTELKNQMYSLVGAGLSGTGWDAVCARYRLSGQLPEGPLSQAATSDDGKAPPIQFDRLLKKAAHQKTGNLDIAIRVGPSRRQRFRFADLPLVDYSDIRVDARSASPPRHHQDSDPRSWCCRLGGMLGESGLPASSPSFAWGPAVLLA